MKSNIFREVLDEEYIQVNKSVSKTTQYLTELGSLHSEPIRHDALIACRCSKKGKITVNLYNPTTSWRSLENQYPLYYIYGQVISKDNKTYVHMTSVYKKSEIYTEIFWSILAILLLPFGIIFLLDNLKLKLPLALISLIIGFFGTVNYRSNIAARKSRGLTMLPHMKNELKKCVETIEKW